MNGDSRFHADTDRNGHHHNGHHYDASHLPLPWSSPVTTTDDSPSSREPQRILRETSEHACNQRDSLMTYDLVPSWRIGSVQLDPQPETLHEVATESISGGPARIFSADQSEAFAWTMPSRNTQAPGERIMFRRESLRNLMIGDLSDFVFDRYYAAYSQCFTNENEAESKDDLRGLLEKGVGDWDIGVVSRGAQFVAGYHTKLASISSYNLGLFSIGEYLWTAKSIRGSGLGKHLYAKTIELRQTQGAQGHFGEIRDINLLPTEELVRDIRSGTGAKERIGFWKKQERLALDAPWIQPPLSAGKEEVDFYMLTMSRLIDQCPTQIPREAYLELWTKFYPRHIDSPSFEKLKALTEDSPTIGLIPIDQPRSFIRRAREML